MNPFHHSLARFFIIPLILLLSQCEPAQTHDEAEPHVFRFGNGEIEFRADFEGGKLNSVTQIDEKNFLITSWAEDYPIDRSPTYAFQIISQEDRKINLSLEFKGAKAPGTPKSSLDGHNWKTLPCQLEGIDLQMSINLRAGDTLWLARHPIYTSSDVQEWIEDISNDERVHPGSCGQSVGGKPIAVLDIYADNPEGKDILVLFARQHPTEVPGQEVFATYVETLLEEHTAESAFFDRYRILAFPLLNPDAVDRGRWRHNLNGMDLNRHWTDSSSQTEVRAVIDYLNDSLKGGQMKFAIDFHSRDGACAFYVTERDEAIVRNYHQLIAKRNPPLNYEVLTSFPSFSKIAVPNYSNTWFNAKNVPIVIHETTHDVVYEDAIATARKAADALVELLMELPEE